MAKIVVTAIEKLFRDLTKLKPKVGETRAAFLERLLKAGQEIEEGVWKKNVPQVAGAEEWYNEAAAAWSASNDAADIPEPVDPEEETGDGEEVGEEATEEETGEAEAESEEAEEPEAEAEEETGEADPEEQVEEENVTMPKTATARKAVAKAPAKAAKRVAPAPAKRAAPPVARKAVPPAKAVPAKKAAVKAPAPAKKGKLPPAGTVGKPKPQVGATSVAKRLLWENPNQSVGELRAAVDRVGVLISDVTLSTIRADFRHSLRVLIEAGALKKAIRLE